jgi:hypothetical protein
MSPGSLGGSTDGSPAAGVEIRPGERVAAVQDIPIEEVKRLRTAASRARVGDHLRFTLKERETGSTRGITLPPQQAALESKVVALDLVVATVVALCYLAIAWLVAWKRPGDRRARVFHALSVTVAFAFVLDAVMRVESTTPWGEATPARQVLRGVVALVWLVALLLFFQLVLGLASARARLSRSERVVLGALYGGACFSILALPSIGFRSGGTWGVVLSMTALSMGLCMLVAVAVAHYVAGTREERRQLQWPFFAFGVAAASTVWCVATCRWASSSRSSPVYSTRALDVSPSPTRVSCRLSSCAPTGPGGSSLPEAPRSVPSPRLPTTKSRWISRPATGWC